MNRNRPRYTLNTVKVALIGPKQGGKTCLSNHLANLPPVSSSSSSSAYDPTVGVRILEFEREIKTAKHDTTVAVELWDCSGDQRYENCWPAIMKDLHGIVVVFDPNSKSQSNDIKLWCEWFVKNANLQTGQAVIFALNNNTDANNTAAPAPITIELPDKKTVSVPIIKVQFEIAKKTDNDSPREGKNEAASGAVTNPTEQQQKQSLAQQQFDAFLGSVYPFHPEVESDGENAF